MASNLGHSCTVTVPAIVTAVPEVRTSFNEFDEFGLLTSLPRLAGEKNIDYKRRILDVYIHRANSTYQGMVYGITRELGLDLFQPISINPKLHPVTGDFYAPNPFIKFDGVWLYLYSDYANGLLDYQIDRFAPGGNYEHLTRLVDLINTTTNFEATLLLADHAYTRSMTIMNQTNWVEEFVTVPATGRFRLPYPHVVPGSLIFSDTTTFNRLVATIGQVVSPGQYYIDYRTGIVTAATTPPPGGWLRYKYVSYPFKPLASPVVLHDINSDNFRVKMFEQILLDDGTYTHGVPTPLGVDIINELLSVYPATFGE